MSNIDLEHAIAASTNRAVPVGGGFEARMAAGAWVRLRARRRRRAIGAGIAAASAVALAVVIGAAANEARTGESAAAGAQPRAGVSVAERAEASLAERAAPTMEPRAPQPAPTTRPAGGAGADREQVRARVTVVSDAPDAPDPVVAASPGEPGHDLSVIADLYDVLAAPDLDDLERLEQIAELARDGLDLDFDVDVDLDDLRGLDELVQDLSSTNIVDPETLRLVRELSDQWKAAPGGDASWDVLRKLYEHCEEHPQLDDDDWNALRLLYDDFGGDSSARGDRHAKRRAERARRRVERMKRRVERRAKRAEQMRLYRGDALREAEELRAKADELRAKADELRRRAMQQARDGDRAAIDPLAHGGDGDLESDSDADALIVDPAAGDQRGVLRINADPWAEVYIDGKKVGNTPVILETTPGSHVIELRTRDGHRSKHRVVVKPGSVRKLNERFR